MSWIICVTCLIGYLVSKDIAVLIAAALFAIAGSISEVSYHVKNLVKFLQSIKGITISKKEE